MLSTTVGGGFGQNRLPIRSAMQQYHQAIATATTTYIKGNQNDPIYAAALRVLNGLPDGNDRLNQIIYGIVNYVDYLSNVTNVPGDQAVSHAVELCTDGFMAGILLRSPLANELDMVARNRLSMAQNELARVVEIVNINIVPLIKAEQGGQAAQSLIGGQQTARRQGLGSQIASGQGGGLNFTAGIAAAPTANQGSLFSNNAPPPPSQGGGIDVTFGAMAEIVPSYVAPVVEPLQFTKTAVPTVTYTQLNVVTMMNYEEHKTYGLLKSKLPSDGNRKLFSAATVDTKFASAREIESYTKLGKEVATTDLVTKPGAGYALEPIYVAYGQRDYASHVSEVAGIPLKLDRVELQRLTFTGLIVQMFPEMIPVEKVQPILDEASGGIVTHGRLTNMMAQLETVFSPETMIILSDKLASYAQDFWRYSMQNLKGEFKNYYEGHHGATEYLLHAENKADEQVAWANFPSVVMSKMFKTIDLLATAEQEATKTLCYKVGYIRIPYFAVELPLGIKDESTGDVKPYGLILRNATPGIYNLCKTLHEAYPDALHRVLITNDGRVIEVIKPLIGEQDRFYIREKDSLL